MRRFPAKTAIYLSCRHVDMRKSINGLAAVVQGSFELDLFNGALFVFCNRERDKIKVLHWDKDGFALYYKRRERGRFCWPSFSEQAGTADITLDDLHRLLDGLLMEKFLPHISFKIM
jgi:transposase